jgi:hypothetical protein
MWMSVYREPSIFIRPKKREISVER